VGGTGVPPVFLTPDRRDAGPTRQINRDRPLDFDKALERDLIDPLVRQAATAADAVQRNLLVAAAGVSRLLHPQAVLVSERLSRLIGDIRTQGPVSLPISEVQSLFALTDRLVNAAREARPCWQGTNRIAKPLALPTPALNSAGSVSARRS